jgi:alcohol dehydrogenase class IV
MVPHGISVILNAPAAFRLIGPSAAERHLRAAQAIGADTRNVPEERAGDVLAEQVIKLMRATGVPNGLAGVGYSDADIDALTQRTLPQRRLLDIAPRDISDADLRQLFKDSMRLW